MKRKSTRMLEPLLDVLESWGWLPREAERVSRARTGLSVILHLPEGGDRPVGTLELDRGEFVFRYDPAYAADPDAPSLRPFPDKKEQYRSTRLWPFFDVRLPPMDRGDVQAYLHEHGIDPEDTLRVLATLARRSVSGPYELRPIGEPRAA